MSEWADVVDDLPPGARVVIRHPGGERLADLLIACLEARLVAVPLHPRAGDVELQDTVARVSASSVVDGSGGTTTITRRDGDPGHPDADGLALIVFTSGSTGRPKGVMLPREAVLGNAADTARLHGIDPTRPHGTCLPLHHCNALVMSLYGTHLTGGTLVLSEWTTPEAYTSALDAKGARTASIVPALLDELIEAAPAWPESLDYLITAAAPLTQDMARRFHRRYGPRLRQGFGLSETVNFSALMPRLDDADFVAQYVDAVPPVGLPVGDTEIRLEDGEVLIRASHIMRGYWEDPEATAEVFDDDGWFRSGDLGEFRDGYLVLRGRRSERINRGGEKYHPLDLEARWRARGASPEGVAVPVADAVLGQDIGLVLEGQDPESTRELVEGPGPRPAVVASGGVSRTATGKPQRAAMGRELAVRRDNVHRYEELLGHAVTTGRALLAHDTPVTAPRAVRLRGQVEALVRAAPDLPAPEASGTGRSVAHDCLDLLLERWPDVAVGHVTGDDLMREHPGTWRRLMTEWPMGSYAQAAADVLRAGDMLRGRVLEVGAGVGNTTELVAHEVRGEFWFSDRVPALVERGTWPGRGVVVDLDDFAPEIGSFDTIFATNVLHCARDRRHAVGLLRSLLSDGGRLVIAEGAPATRPGHPWALDHLFSLWDGWWDRGGFRDRWEWLDLLAGAGLRDRGFSMLRAGRHDLGGVVWGRA